MLPPTQTPNASQWNIGGVGSSGIGVRTAIGHVHFMLFVISFGLGTQRKRVFSGILALRIDNRRQSVIHATLHVLFYSSNPHNIISHQMIAYIFVYLTISMIL